MPITGQNRSIVAPVARDRVALRRARHVLDGGERIRAAIAIVRRAGCEIDSHTGAGLRDPRDRVNVTGDARAPAVTAAGERFWIACEATDGDDVRIRVEHVTPGGESSAKP